MLLVLAIPVVGGVLLVVEDLKAVRLNLLALGVEPGAGRMDG